MCLGLVTVELFCYKPENLGGGEVREWVWGDGEGFLRMLSAGVECFY